MLAMRNRRRKASTFQVMAVVPIPITRLDSSSIRTPASRSLNYRAGSGQVRSIRPGAFADYLARLGRWYNWAYLVPESNDAGFIDAMVRTGYPLQQIYSRQ